MRMSGDILAVSFFSGLRFRVETIILPAYRFGQLAGAGAYLSGTP